MLNRRACALAIRGGHEALLGDLRAILPETGPDHAAGDARRYADLDTAFHRFFFRFCPNALVLDAYNLADGDVRAFEAILQSHVHRTELVAQERLGDPAETAYRVMPGP